jgi:RimJ/RimL family protein N-acetyltransferase
VTLVTRRLTLRQWHDADRAPFAQMNADPEVMRHFPATSTVAESDALIDRAMEHLDEHGWGLRPPTPPC